MSELLRAVLDASCIDSQFALYTSSLTVVDTNTGAKTFGRRQTVIQCKSDTWFLMMGWEQDVASLPPALNGGVWTSKTEPSTFQIRNLKNTFHFSESPVIKSLMGYNLNNFVYLPEYHLWEPSDLIGISEDVQITDNAGFSKVNFVTLVGIEYKMPEEYNRARFQAS